MAEPQNAIDLTGGEPASGPIPAEPIEYAKPTTPNVHLASGITRGDVAALAVRLLGIYMVVVGLPAIGYVVGSLFGPLRLNRQLEFYLIYEIIFLGGGGFMVAKAAMIGGWLLPRATLNPQMPSASGSPQELQAVAFSIVGLVLAVSACPTLISLLVEALATPHPNLLQSLPTGVEFVLGVLLFFRGKRLARYWQALPAAPMTRNDDAGPL